MAKPRVFAVYWGDYFFRHPEAPPMLNSFFSTLLTSSYMDPLGEYGVGRGTFVGSVTIAQNASVGSPVTPAPPLISSGVEFTGQLRHWLDDGSVSQKPGWFETDLLYVVFCPADTVLQNGDVDSNHGLVGYHTFDWHAKYPLLGWPNLFAAALAWPLTDSDPTALQLVDAVTPFVSHEMVEAFTDRDNLGFSAPGTGCEIGDMCENLRTQIGSSKVEPYWSNAAMSCVPLGGPPSVLSTRLGAYFTDSDSTLRLVYVSGLGHIIELWKRITSEWMLADLTQIARAPQALGNPFGYVTTFDQTARVICRSAAAQQGGGSHIHELRLALSAGATWQWADLTLLTQAPIAITDPMAYVTPWDETARLVYVSSSGHVIELSISAGRAWSVADLSSATGAPPTLSAPYGYVTNGNLARVVYLANDGHVNELWLPQNGTWHRADLTALAGAPDGIGEPFGYVTPFDSVARVLYWGVGSHLNELSLALSSNGATWQHADLTDISHGPGILGRAAAMTTPDFTAHVLYRGQDRNLHHLSLATGSWRYESVSNVARAASRDDPQIYGVAWDNGAHALYANREGVIEECDWSPSAMWSVLPLSQLAHP